MRICIAATNKQPNATGHHSLAGGHKHKRRRHCIYGLACAAKRNIRTMMVYGIDRVMQLPRLNSINQPSTISTLTAHICAGVGSLTLEVRAP